jgi:hypothetical protein
MDFPTADEVVNTIDFRRKEYENFKKEIKKESNKVYTEVYNEVCSKIIEQIKNDILVLSLNVRFCTYTLDYVKYNDVVENTIVRGNFLDYLVYNILQTSTLNKLPEKYNNKFIDLYVIEHHEKFGDAVHLNNDLYNHIIYCENILTYEVFHKTYYTQLLDDITGILEKNGYKVTFYDNKRVFKINW